MEAYQKLINKAKISIDRHFGPHSHSPKGKKSKRTGNNSKCSSFKVTERIYTAEKKEYMQEVKLLAVPGNVKSPFRHLRVRKSFATNYVNRRNEGRPLSSSPAKSGSGYVSRLTSLTGSPDIRRSSGSSPTRSPTLATVHSVHLHTLMDICDQARSQIPLIPEVRKQQIQSKHYRQRLNQTGQALEDISDSPVEVLEPLFNLRKESDLAMKRDAMVMANEEKGSTDESFNQVKMMLAKGIRSRRSFSQ